MPEVHDFIPLDEGFEQAGNALVSSGSAWLNQSAADALSGSEGLAIEFGDARLIERGVVVPVRWVAGRGPFKTLEANIRLEPMPTRHSHLSFSGTFEGSVNGHDPVTQQHLTEAAVRRFLVSVATALEHGGDGRSSRAS